MDARFEARFQRRVVFAQSPRFDESLIGFLDRAAEFNVLEAPSDLLNGIPTTRCKSLSKHQRANLALAVGADLREIDAAFARTFETGVPAHYLSYKVRRTSPTALANLSHVRAAWHVKPLTFCSRSWDMLIDSCPKCRVRLRWDDYPMSRCRRCDFALSAAKTERVAKSLRPTLLQAEGLALPEGRSVRDILRDVDPKIAALAPADAFDLAVQFGWALAAPVAGISRKTLLGLDPRDLAAGVRVLKGYPDSVIAMQGGGLNQAERAFFRRLTAVAQSREGPLADLLAEVDDLRTSHRGVSRLKQARVENKLMTISNVAAELRLERSVVKKMVDHKIFGELPTRGALRSYGWFSQSDIERGQAFRDSRVGAQHWSSKVGLCHGYVRQLLALGLVAEPEPGPKRSVFGGLQLSSDSVDQFERSLQEAISFDDEDQSDWVLLPQALAVIGGSHKPVGPILHAALSGGLPEGLRGQRFRGLLSRVFIHRSVADDIALRAVSGAPQLYCMGESAFGAYWPSVMSRTEVEEILNCSPPDFDAVRAEGHLLSAPGCRSAVATRHVMDFGASFISTREISRLTKLEVRGVDKEMKRLGYDRRCAGFWSRQDFSGPNGLLSAHRSNRRIFGVWSATEFGLPMPAWLGSEAYDTPEVEDDFRFAEKARLIFGTRTMQTS
nr:hypothetical protein [uncultured Brevundimonas sp.]